MPSLKIKSSYDKHFWRDSVEEVIPSIPRSRTLLPEYHPEFNNVIILEEDTSQE